MSRDPVTTAQLLRAAVEASIAFAAPLYDDRDCDDGQREDFEEYIGRKYAALHDAANDAWDAYEARIKA